MSSTKPTSLDPFHDDNMASDSEDDAAADTGSQRQPSYGSATSHMPSSHHNVSQVASRIPQTINEPAEGETSGSNDGGEISTSNTTLNKPSPPQRPSTLRNSITNVGRSFLGSAPQRQQSLAQRRPLMPSRQTQLAQQPVGQLGWTEEGYYDQNPWYGDANKKPIFSLGKPLPHTVRRRYHKRLQAPARKDEETGVPEASSGQEDVEGNEPTGENGAPMFLTPSGQRVHSPSQRDALVAEEQEHQSRTTAAGAAHTQRRNDAEQPVFNYLPGEDEEEEGADDIDPDSPDAGSPMVSRSTSYFRRPTRQGTEHQSQDHKDQKDQKNTSDQPDYKVDGEPIAQTEQLEAEKGKVDPNELRNWWARLRAKNPEPLAEFLCGTVAFSLGLAATLSVNLSAYQETQYGTFETGCWAYGFAWMLGIYLGGGVSGAHMNPSISLSFSIFRGFPWRQCVLYVSIQILAGLAAGAIAYGLYADSIRYVDPDLEIVSSTFYSTPREWMTLSGAFFNQLFGGAIMMIAVFALGDDQNNPPGAGMHALVMGFLVVTLRVALGYNVGPALNPAADFGPRVIAYFIGVRDPSVFQTLWWLYGPWVATTIGSLLGCVIYDGCIFVGSESPINYRYNVQDELKERTKKYFSFAREE